MFEFSLFSLTLLSVLLSFVGNENNRLRALIAGQAAAFFSSIGLAVTVFTGLAQSQTQSGLPGLVMVDSASAMVSVLVSFIGLITLVFSERYMLGEKSRLSFCRLLVLMALTAQLTALSNHMILSLLAYGAISVLLYLFMNLRAESRKLAVSVLKYHLLADFFLAFAFATLYFDGGPLHFSRLKDFHVNSSLFNLGAYLLVLSLCIKSALFPFHRWLLNTLNCPTPLSGLMHAGVVNIAGVMACKVYPALQLVPGSLYVWGALALVSAMVGTLTMSTQFDVKRKLVYSTVGQMGFMSLQCACGLVPAAVFHLIAHGLFKCHMFLQSGSSVNEGLIKKEFAAIKKDDAALSPLAVSLVFVTLAFVIFYAFGTQAVASTLALAASVPILLTMPAFSRVSAPVALALAAATALLVFTSVSLAVSFEHALSMVSFSSPAFWLLPLAFVFFLVFHFLVNTAGKGKNRLADWLYVQALSGFYV
ncbi:MAG: hypothetical protein LCH63_11310 [Candidatus Melainabacteria bacterium]|nr:hypothetical protein [Candidatus Melainabacteria bacterium]